MEMSPAALFCMLEQAGWILQEHNFKLKEEAKPSVKLNSEPRAHNINVNNATDSD